jgi:hypothetical protein
MLPFLATFALGVFIASFFVSVGPGFGLSERRIRRFQEMQRLRIENDELREENDRLKNKLDMKWPGQIDQEDRMSWQPETLHDPPPPPPRPAPRPHH